MSQVEHSGQSNPAGRQPLIPTIILIAFIMSLVLPTLASAGSTMAGQDTAAWVTTSPMSADVSAGVAAVSLDVVPDPSGVAELSPLLEAADFGRKSDTSAATAVAAGRPVATDDGVTAVPLPPALGGALVTLGVLAWARSRRRIGRAAEARAA